MVWLLACAPGPEVVSAEEIGVLEQSGLVDGRDGGGSAVVFGTSVWTYGDTVLTVPDEDGETWHHNSVSLTLDLDAADGVGGFWEPLDGAGAPAHLIPPNEAERAFNLAHDSDECTEEPCGARWAVWPGAPIWDAERERALVPYGLIYAEPGAFNFEGVGQSLAVWTALDAAPERPVIDAGAEHPDLMWAPADGSWGATGAIDGDFLVLFDCEAGVHDCRVGRAPLDEVLDVGAWRYWDGASWVAGPEHAAVLFAGAPILSLSWNRALGAWLVVYSPPLDHAVYARTAPALEGPWSDASVLYVAPEADAPYDVVHHPELETADGAVQYLTYHRATSGWFGTEFPIVRVELR